MFFYLASSATYLCLNGKQISFPCCGKDLQVEQRGAHRLVPLWALTEWLLSETVREKLIIKKKKKLNT